MPFGVSEQFMFLRMEELREGIGPAIVRAKDMLMLLLSIGEFPKALYLYPGIVPHQSPPIRSRYSVFFE